jgi:hypothetical protein
MTKTQTPTITYHGPDRERPTQFKVIVRIGSVAVHHARLTAAEYEALLASPSFTRPGTAPALAAGAALAAEVLAS